MLAGSDCVSRFNLIRGVLPIKSTRLVVTQVILMQLTRASGCDNNYQIIGLCGLFRGLSGTIFGGNQSVMGVRVQYSEEISWSM